MLNVPLNKIKAMGGIWLLQLQDKKSLWPIIELGSLKRTNCRVVMVDYTEWGRVWEYLWYICNLLVHGLLLSSSLIWGHQWVAEDFRTPLQEVVNGKFKLCYA